MISRPRARPACRTCRGEKEGRSERPQILWVTRKPATTEHTVLLKCQRHQSISETRPTLHTGRALPRARDPASAKIPHEASSPSPRTLFRDNPVSVLTALQRARISWIRPAEPHLTARRGQHRPLPEAFRVLRVGLPGRRQHIELQREQQLGSALAPCLFHLRQQRLGLSHPRRPNVESPDPESGRDHATQGEHPADDRCELRGRVQLYPSMADPRGWGRRAGHLPRRLGGKPGRDRRRQHGHRTARNRRRIRQRRHRQRHRSQFRQYRGRGRFLAKRERHDGPGAGHHRESGIRSRLGSLRNIRAAAVLQRQYPEMRHGSVHRRLDRHGRHRRQQDHVRRGRGGVRCCCPCFRNIST